MEVSEVSVTSQGPLGWVAVSKDQLKTVVYQLPESNQRWEERNAKWEDAYQELWTSYREVEDTVPQVKESNKKMEALHLKMEASMKDMSEHFKLIQNHVSKIVASQNGHTMTLETYRQSLHTLWCLVEDSQGPELTAIKYIPPPSIPCPFTPMTNSAMGWCIVPLMLEMMMSPAFTTQTHLA